PFVQVRRPALESVHRLRERHRDARRGRTVQHRQLPRRQLALPDPRIVRSVEAGMDRLRPGDRLLEHTGGEEITGDAPEAGLLWCRAAAQHGDGVAVREGAVDDRPADLSFSDDEVMHEGLQNVSTALCVTDSVNTALAPASRALLSECGRMSA